MSAVSNVVNAALNPVNAVSNVVNAALNPVNATRNPVSAASNPVNAVLATRERRLERRQCRLEPR